MKPRKHTRTPVEWAGLAVLVMMAVLFLSACNSDDIESLPESKYQPPSLGPGIHQNLPVSTLKADRWTQCYAGLYNVFFTPVNAFLGDCGNGFLMLACRPAGTTTLTLAAYATKAEILTDTGGSGGFHVANGVAWYYGESFAIGFFEPGDGVTHGPCDSSSGTFPERRLCWHTLSSDGGYRCGTTTGLNSSTSWERVIYRHL